MTHSNNHQKLFYLFQSTKTDYLNFEKNANVNPFYTHKRGKGEGLGGSIKWSRSVKRL